MEHREPVARDEIDAFVTRDRACGCRKRITEFAIERGDVRCRRNVWRERQTKSLAQAIIEGHRDETLDRPRIRRTFWMQIDEHGVDPIERCARHQSDRAHQPNAVKAASQTAARRSRTSRRP